MRPPALWRRLHRGAVDPDYRDDVDADLCEEFEARAGETSPRAARRWYRRQVLGFVVQRLRDPRPRHRRSSHPAGLAGPGEHMQSWARELRHAARSLGRTPAFTAMTIGTLALAIGATAGLFAVVHPVLVQPLPYAHPGRLVHIAASAPGSDLPDEFGVGMEFLLHYREQSRLLEDVSTYNSFTSTLRVGDRVERIRMSQPTTSLFTTLGVTPLLGRVPTAADENRVAVISHALWTSWFGQDPEVVGRAYHISGMDRTIVGVMPREFRFPEDGTLLWMSSPDVRAEGLQPGRFGPSLVGRLAPGATPEALATELTALARQLPDRFGSTPAYDDIIARHRAVVRPLGEEIVGAVAAPLWVLFAAAAIVLAIACANVANLFTVRTEGRQRDLAVRRAIGATRSQLIRLQMAEAVVVAIVAAAVAVVLGLMTLPLFLQVVPAGIPRLEDVRFGPAAAGFTLALAAFVALACGAGPAIRASRPDFTRLREGGRGGTGRRRWTRDALVVGQTALALVLLIGSGLLMRSFAALQQVDPGYETENLFTFQIAPDRPTLHDGPTFARFDLAFMDRLRALPGVESVGLIENVPLNESPGSARLVTEDTAGTSGIGTQLPVTFTAGDYFETMGIAVLDGRPLETNDHLSALPNIVVSESVAEQLWPGERAVGRRLQPEGGTTWYTVVGVVEDVMQDHFREPAQPLVYLPIVGPTPTAWFMSSPAYVIRTSRAETIAADVRTLVREVAPEAPMYRAFTMAELARDSMVQLSFTMLTLAIVSGMALLLGAVGLYAVLSYVVAQRRREIGVRLALGARVEQVRRMVVVQGTRVVLIGVGIGVLGALGATRALGSLLYGVEALDPVTFAGMSVAMIGIGLLASYLPARRASSVDPIESLRGD